MATVRVERPPLIVNVRVYFEIIEVAQIVRVKGIYDALNGEEWTDDTVDP